MNRMIENTTSESVVEMFIEKAQELPIKEAWDYMHDLLDYKALSHNDLQDIIEIIFTIGMVDLGSLTKLYFAAQICVTECEENEMYTPLIAISKHAISLLQKNDNEHSLDILYILMADFPCIVEHLEFTCAHA